MISDDQVRDILKSSRRNNPLLGITGVLIHGGGLFMQVLEGPEQGVLRKYVQILDDQRHSNSKIVHISPAKERMFQEWSMGVINSDPLDFHYVTELTTHRLESAKEKAFTNTMRDFLGRLKAGQ